MRLFKHKSTSDALPPQHGLKTYFAVQKFAFNCMGIDVTSQNRTIFNPLLNWIPMALLTTLCVFMLIYAAQYRHDIDLMTDILAPFCQALLALIKMWVFFWNKKKVVNLVRHIWLWNLEGRDDELDIIRDENRKDNFNSTLFFRFVMATVAMAFSSPILEAFFYYLKGHGFMDHLDLPFKAAYHIAMDPKSYNGYILAYIWNVISIIYILNGAIANDTLFSWIAHNVSAQFRILNLRLKKTANSVRKSGDEREFIRAIIQNIKYHHRVIELADNFNDAFMVTVFFKYTISFLQIACLIFQIARGGELATLVFHILFLIAVSIQLMMYCHGGQKIIDGSTSVAVSIYEYFQWHNMSIKSKKLLILSMMRAQKPCILTGVFFVADLNLFLWVLKTSGSLFTMLKSMEA
ncbi:Odorant receptor 45a [Lucilia cuprina]|nr:Odorant receptor 45a [Lucilia cuprina]